MTARTFSTASVADASFGAQPWTRATLADMAAEKSFEIEAPRLGPLDTAILGRMNNLRCHSGLYLHATDTFEAHDLQAHWVMAPSFTVAVMLEGALDVWMDETQIRLDAASGPTGHAWSLTRTARMTRQSRKGTHVRKVVITVPRTWIGEVLTGLSDREATFGTLAVTHAAHGLWTPSRHVVALAEQILNPGLAPAALQNMSAESRALEIVREAFASMMSGQEAMCPGPASVRLQVRASSIRDYIRDNIEKLPGLAEMARQLGMSVGSMQEAFKATYGETVGEYSRRLRLERARTAIEHDGLSVGEAAYIAGYSNPASFATAFKRRFGLSPSDARS